MIIKVLNLETDFVNVKALIEFKSYIVYQPQPRETTAGMGHEFDFDVICVSFIISVSALSYLSAAGVSVAV